MSLRTKHEHYEKCVLDWCEADRECIRAYAIWQDANERRRRLAKFKVDAWREYTAEIERRSAAPSNHGHDINGERQ